MTFKCSFSVSSLFSDLIKHSINRFDARVAQAPGTVLLVNHLKTSSMDSVAATYHILQLRSRVAVKIKNPTVYPTIYLPKLFVT